MISDNEGEPERKKKEIVKPKAFGSGIGKYINLQEKRKANQVLLFIYHMIS